MRFSSSCLFIALVEMNYSATNHNAMTKYFEKKSKTELLNTILTNIPFGSTVMTKLSSMMIMG